MSSNSLALSRKAVLALAAAAAVFCAVPAANAGVVLTGGGLTLAEQGGTFDAGNLATGGPALASSDLGPELGIPFHRTFNLNDATYGNSNSWIGGDANPFPLPFAGVSFGGSFSVQSLAFGRDNLGAFGDRNLGLYTLQFTNDPAPSSATPDASWTTIGTLDYQSAGGANFNNPALRHRYNFSAVTATALRLLVPGTGLGAGTDIDEFEVYHNAGVIVAPPPHVVLSPAPGFGIGFNGNNGDHSTPDSPAPVPDNPALASRGATPFTSSDLGPVLGIPFHRAVNINDGLYGNSHSWIPDFINGDGNPFAGVAFAEPLMVSAVAFGRDNGDVAGDCCGGTLTDRSLGRYSLQFTQVLTPDAFTPETGDPATGWADIGSIDYLFADTGFDPFLRHEFRIGSFDGDALSDILMTGLRIKAPDANSDIDEIEVIGVAVPEPTSLSLLVLGAAGLLRRRRA